MAVGNDATRELGGTLGVAVVGSYFSSVYAAHLTSGAFGSLPAPAPALARGKDSVSAAITIAHDTPGLLASVRDAFMAGLHAGSVLVAVVCLAGAVAALLFLPGRLPAQVARQAAPHQDALTPVG